MSMPSEWTPFEQIHSMSTKTSDLSITCFVLKVAPRSQRFANGVGEGSEGFGDGVESVIQ